MRGQDTQQSTMFSYLAPEDRVPADHPLRPIRQMVLLLAARYGLRPCPNDAGSAGAATRYPLGHVLLHNRCIRRWQRRAFIRVEAERKA